MAVRTKFQLHKECHFGEHFLLVGNEPDIGMWNPSKAIPLNWSHGNIWTTEIVRAFLSSCYVLGMHWDVLYVCSELGLCFLVLFFSI